MAAGKKKVAEAEVPQFCGFSCPHSDFPPADSAGLCRTMAPVYCTKLRKLVDKNAPCRWRRGPKARGKPRR
jgi:hypothetical protein